MNISLKIDQDVLDGRVKRVCGEARQRRGLRARNYREVALGRLEHMAGVLQERRGRLAMNLDRARSHLDRLAPRAGWSN